MEHRGYYIVHQWDGIRLPAENYALMGVHQINSNHEHSKIAYHMENHLLQRKWMDTVDFVKMFKEGLGERIPRSTGVRPIKFGTKEW